ncbi:MAG: tRNA lysidine(34) synthetase TilS [Myxococcota bacterium]|nr:tRNA lysidine(34) synthetase TilS [Myxococcota bacterium]
MKPPPSGQTIETRAMRAFAGLVQPGSAVLLAVSGGSDSLGLMHLASKISKQFPLALAVGFIDHGLRDGIEQELRLVQHQAHQLGVPVYTASIQKGDATSAKSQGDLQAWARDRRYQLLTRLAAGFGAPYIATGHTRDDQTETILMRLIRGSGIDGLVGIPSQREIASGTTVIRPLLDISRESLRTYLSAKEQAWIEDPSNQDDRYMRVRIRNALIPLLDSLQTGASRKIAALAGDAQDARHCIETLVTQDEANIKKLNLNSGLKVASGFFQNHPTPYWRPVIRAVLRQIRGDLRHIERNHIELIASLVASGKCSSALPLPGNTAVFVDRGALFAFPTPLPPAPADGIPLERTGTGSWRASLTPLKIGVRVDAKTKAAVHDLALRVRRPGDRLLNASRKLKKLLNQAHIPGPYRPYIPVLARQNAVVASPGLVENRDQTLRIAWHIAPDSPLLDIKLDLHMRLMD